MGSVPVSYPADNETKSACAVQIGTEKRSSITRHCPWNGLACSHNGECAVRGDSMALGSGTWKMTHHANTRGIRGVNVFMYYEVVQLPIRSRNSSATPLVKMVTLRFESEYIGSVAASPQPLVFSITTLRLSLLPRRRLAC